MGEDEKTQAARRAIARSQRTIRAARATLERLRGELVEQRERMRGFDQEVERVTREAVTLKPPLAPQ